jgi:excisionase family DNA binding protein
MEKQFYSVEELAAALHLHPTTIREHARAGRIPAVRIGRLWRFPKEWIDRWLEEQRVLRVAVGSPPDPQAGSALAAGGRPKVTPTLPSPKRSIMELHGLGREIWEGIDAQEYVNELRKEWDPHP